MLYSYVHAYARDMTFLVSYMYSHTPCGLRRCTISFPSWTCHCNSGFKRL